MKKTFFIILLAFACILAIAPSALAKTAAFNPVSKKVLAIPQKYIKKGVLVDFKLNKNATNAAYIIENTSDNETRNFVVFNGIAGKEYDVIDMLTFSPDGKKVFYRAKNTKPKETYFFVETTGKTTKAKKVSGVIESLKTPGWGFPFLNGKPVYFTTSKKGIHALFVGNKKIPYAHSAFFNKEGTKMAYLYDYAHDNGMKGHQVVVDGKPGKTYPTIYNYQFNDDGTVSYVIGDDDKVALIRDGEEIVSYPDPDEEGWLAAIISPDGKNMLARRQKQTNEEYIYMNAQKSGRFDGGSYPEDPLLAFSPDSKKIAYAVVKDNSMYVITDENDGASKVNQDRPYISVGNMLFSNDSKHFAYTGKSTMNGTSEDGTVTTENIADIVIDDEVISTFLILAEDELTGIYNLNFSPSNILLYTVDSFSDGVQKLYKDGTQILDYATDEHEIVDKDRIVIQNAPFSFDDNGEYVGFGAVKINPETSEWEIWWVAEKL